MDEHEPGRWDAPAKAFDRGDRIVIEPIVIDDEDGRAARRIDVGEGADEEGSVSARSESVAHTRRLLRDDDDAFHEAPPR